MKYLTAIAAVGFSLAMVASTGARADAVVYTDQGSSWTDSARTRFYTQDQGSRLMPLAWLKALKQPNGQPFLADNLARYGYLPLDPPAPSSAVAIGFPITGITGHEEVGMTCSACHTREITVSGTRYRIDGGPAMADFHAFMLDIDKATQQIRNDPKAFQSFAQQVLSPEDYASSTQLARLQKQFNLWTERYHTIVVRGLPHDSWGVSRLDAVGMIFNRLTGLDLGPPPARLIPENIKTADAPVRYPFLWNAAIQDRTQWPGFAANGNDLLGLARNVGEVYGVFGHFMPEKSSGSLLGVNYLHGNSLNFAGLSTLENLIKVIGPPHYPFPVDLGLAAKGEEVFNRPASAGGCVSCHGITAGETRFFNQKTWKTPLIDVGTDTREYNVMNWSAQTGVMKGAPVPFSLKKLGATAPSIDILTVAVEGSILQHYAPDLFGAKDDLLGEIASKVLAETDLDASLKELQQAFPTTRGEKLQAAASGQNGNSQATASKAATGGFVYESRVMQGIWAAAPYLHNGSVPTLADLLQPSALRPQQFAVGRNYDPQKVGLAASQSDSVTTTTITTGCDQLNSGNSHCGHEYGTALSDAEKQALLEYLKTL